MDDHASIRNQPPLPARIPDHELLRRIGSGSYGAVWLARNSLGVFRAVKIVYRHSFDSDKPFGREWSGIRKFEPISRSHEGFVDVLHVGINEAEGYFYYVMELGDDQESGQRIKPETYTAKTLGRQISQRGKLSLQECLDLGLALSRAVAELHRCGLVHRDIKPSNIIFVNGVPKLADIGLVAQLDEARSFVGTEGFIPPEGPGTPQADVYSLGKVLYEACTGRDRQDFPELPTRAEALPPDEQEKFLELNAVILHACRPELGRRYATAWEMHADLVVLANGQSVRRLDQLERRFARLKRAGGIAALVLLAVGLVGYQVFRVRQMAAEAKQRQVGAAVANGTRAVESGDLLGALPYFVEALRLDQGDPMRESGERLRVGSVVAQCPKLTQWWFEGKEVKSAEFSADGRRVLLAQIDGQAEIRDLESGAVCGHPFGPAKLASASFSPDGRWVVTASETGEAGLWDVATLEQIRRWAHPTNLLNARFSPDGRAIITACVDGVARIWNAQTGKLEKALQGHTGPLHFAGFSHDGKRVVTTSEDQSAQLWDVAGGERLGPALKHTSWVLDAAFSHDDRKLVTASMDRRARVWDTATGQQDLPELAHGDGVESAEFSPDSRLLVTAGLDGTVRFWRAGDLQPLSDKHILRLGGCVLRARFNPDGHRFLTASLDGSVRIWDLAGSEMSPAAVPATYSSDGSKFRIISNDTVSIYDALTDAAVGPVIRPLAPLRRAELSRDGRFILTVSGLDWGTNRGERLFQVWATASGASLAPAFAVSNAVAGVALSPDGKRLAVFAGPTVQAWDTLNRKPLSEAMAHAQKVEAVLFAPAGERVATLSGQTVQIWDAATGRACLPPMLHSLPVVHAQFSSDGAYLATCCSDLSFAGGCGRVWSTATGQPVSPPLEHRDGVRCIELGPGNRRVSTASEDYTAMVWDVATGRALTPPLQHADQVESVAFSPDGNWIVTAADKSARVWDAGTGEPLTPPLRHLTGLAGARFLPDGAHLVTFAGARSTRRWTLPVEHRSLGGVAELVALLSGGAAASAGGGSRAQLEGMQALWRRFRAQYPGQFSVSAGEATAWHAFEAEESELEQQWFAAVFHLEHLASLRPADTNVSARLARARDRLRNEK